jgi:hypothetical protein
MTSLPGYAQNAENPDDEIVGWLAKQRAEHTGWGIALGDVTMNFYGSQCDGPKLLIWIPQQGNRTRAAIFGYKVTFFTPGFGGIKKLPAGEYLVERAVCSAHGTKTFNGPLARFQVREGEVVNVGRLNLVFRYDNFWWQTSGKTELSVEQLPPKTVDWMTKRFPRVHSASIYRAMTLIGHPK